MENKKELYVSGQEAGPEEVSLKEKGRDTWGKSGSKSLGQVVLVVMFWRHHGCV